MALSPELLGENMQTYEEFRLNVERQMYGESLELVMPGDVPTTPLEKVIFESPKLAEYREAFPHTTSLTGILDRR